MYYAKSLNYFEEFEGKSLHELNSAGIWIKQIWIRLVSPNLSWSAFELKRIKVFRTDEKVVYFDKFSVITNNCRRIVAT